jgi:hypothetical protein
VIVKREVREIYCVGGGQFKSMNPKEVEETKHETFILYQRDTPRKRRWSYAVRGA